MSAMPGMTMGGPGGGPPDLLPTWLGIVGAAVFIAVLASHLRHVLETSGARRWWHCGHVLMAASMAVMYLPATVLRVGIPSGVWQGIFGALIVALLVVGAARLTREPSGDVTAPSALWLLVVLDLGAMIYMWAPSGYTPAASCLATAYLVGESLLWASDRIRLFDRPLTGGSYELSGGGVICIASGATLTTERDLRLSMFAMTAGMAYMIVAMQLMT